jgi:hypothetical protein
MARIFFKKLLLRQRELTYFFTFTLHLVNKFLTLNMARTLRLVLLLLCIGVSGTVFAQPGAITGKVLDEKKAPIINAIIEFTSGGISKGGTVTDYDGIYLMKPLEPGTYTVKISYTSMKTKQINGVLVSPDKTTEVNANLEEDRKNLKEVEIVAYVVPLVDKYDVNKTNKKTSKELEVLPTRNTNDIAGSFTGVYQQKKGADISFSAARTSQTQYIIDGVVQQTPPNGGAAQGINMGANNVQELEVMGSGIAAKYGDAAGGVVSITTKGVTPNLSGDVILQHSVDGYNNNLVSFGLSGPLVKKKMQDGSKKPVMGFNVGAEYYYDKDRSPSYIPTYVVKDNILNNLKQNPLYAKPDNSTGQTIYQYSSEYVTLNDLTTVKSPDHKLTKEVRAHAKFNYQIADNLDLTAGANMDYSASDQFSQGAVLFAGSTIPTQYYTTGSGFIRFTQRFGKAGENNDKSIISNAYYTVQADYQLSIQNQEDSRFGKNIFDYAYIGSFTQNYKKYYFRNFDSVSGKQGMVLNGYFTPDTVIFKRSELNPDLANYTSQYYSILGEGHKPLAIQSIQADNGLVNGDLPNYVYQLFENVGHNQSYYYQRTQQQYSLKVDASFDLKLGKTNHAIEFGLSYQQRLQKYYAAFANRNGFGNGSTLWELMRLLANSHLSMDKTNPEWVKNGHVYSYSDVKNGVYNPGPTDTIIYPLIANLASQSTFDRNLRIKLGLNPDGNDILQPDAVDPSNLSLSMFKADELWNQGKSFVSYYGYNYDGSAQTGTVHFNDFWTATDKNGNFTRPLAPFSPNYTAGYILDKFQFKDIFFNVGLRVERFDANTNVLIDPYSLYPEKHVSDVSGSLNVLNQGTHPANIGSGYVVYVNDNNSSSPNIIGYRNGDQWYDPNGNQIEDPAKLKDFSNGRDPQPYLVNPDAKINSTITDKSSKQYFDPSLSFVQYTPQITLLPRVQFSFPISDEANFFAHYDVYSQRPDANFLSRPSDYYFLQNNSSSIINNPDLKPFKAFDYEVGFQQKLSNHSALTLTGSYKERKDMITMRPYLYAWPVTYYTYGNRDFSSTKALTLKYDLRRFQRLQMGIAYTLQFAEGTGSTPNSGNGGSGGQVSPNGLLQNFIEAGLPNLRYVTALDNDSRHIINANIDYRFANGDGPTVYGKHIFENAGLNFNFSARSGEPYTRYVDAITNTVIGGVNGSRLPWHYVADVRFDKDFLVNFGKKTEGAEAGVKVGKAVVFKAFVIIQNIFNTRDILGVYGYTGRPDDNGYLSSATGQHFVQQQTLPQAYMDMYRIGYNSQGSYNLPRQLTLGLQMNF